MHHTISNYQVTSRSKQFRRLTPKNEHRISKNIVDKNQTKHLLELINKRDYYANKIHELLNNAGEQLDPSLIDDDAEAEYYLAKRFMRVPEKADQVRSIIDKHKRFQEEMARQHEQLVKKHGEMSKTKGLAKLGALNADLDKSKKSATQRDLKNLYEKISDEQKRYSAESDAMLRLLGVPFFALKGDMYGSEELTKHKEYVLRVLQKLL